MTYDVTCDKNNCPYIVGWRLTSVTSRRLGENAARQWATVCALARKVPKPYEVEVLSHGDFDGWDAISERYFKGNLSGKINRIRSATFKKNHTEAETEFIEVLGKIEIMPYKSKLPI
ncbi:hypothetical protein ACJJTC_011568 [Scirpophaga incertulas]